MLLFLDNLCVLFGERFGVFGGLLQEVTKMPTLVNYRGKFLLYLRYVLVKNFLFGCFDFLKNRMSS